MARQETVKTKKRRGPAPTGRGRFVGLRIHSELFGALEGWIARHPEPRPTISDAIRQLVGEALKRKR